MIRNALGAGSSLAGTSPTGSVAGYSGGSPAHSASSISSHDPVAEATFNKALQKMLAAAPGSINIKSGKRDRAHQERLWQEALKKYGDPEVADNWVARPGNSRHEWGIAADLGYADDALRKWAHQNAAQFGLHFPLSNEPWHIELLGSR